MEEPDGWPVDGDGGMKLIRRSVAQLLRDVGTSPAWSPEGREQTRKVPGEQIGVQLGHSDIEGVTSLYSAFDPECHYEAMTALEAIIDAIVKHYPAPFAPAIEQQSNTDDPRSERSCWNCSQIRKGPHA